MENLHTLTELELVDKLSASTTKYLKMIAGGSNFEEVRACKLSIDAIIDEICRRKTVEKKPGTVETTTQTTTEITTERSS